MQNQKIDDWLFKVGSHILRPTYKKAVIKELRAHIDDRIRQFENDGFSTEQAIERTLNIMGDANEIGKEFQKFNRIAFFKAIFLNTLMLVLAFILLVYIISNI